MMNSWKVNLLLIVGRGDYGNDVLRTTLNRVHDGNRLVTVPPLPKGPEGRGGAYASTELLLRWIWSFRRSLALLLPSPSRLGINTGGNTEGGQQGKITFLHSSSHAGPLVARARGSTLDPWLGDPTSLLPLLFWLSICSMAIG